MSVFSEWQWALRMIDGFYHFKCPDSFRTPLLERNDA